MMHRIPWIAGTACGLFMATTVSALADITGFSAFSPINTSGATTAVGVNPAQTEVVLTDGGTQEASSLFDPTRQRIVSWNAEFTYQATGPGGSLADGVVLVFQNDPRGVKAIGTNGRDLGYGGGGEITQSAAFEVDVYNGSSAAVGTGGAIADPIDTEAVDMESGDPIRIDLSYDGAVLTETMVDTVTGDRFTSESALDLPGAVGGDTALVGFTGASGNTTAIQDVSDFQFHVLPDVPPALRKHITPQEAPIAPVKTYETLDDYVDPIIGTGSSVGGDCNTFPGPSAPFGMVQFSPDTSTPSVGYSYAAHDIQGFSMTHMSGPGRSDEGDVFLTATTGPVQTSTSKYQSYFNHAHESVSPGYYQVKLLRFNVNAELTATERTGMIRFTFPVGKAANILVPISHTLTSTVGANIHIVGSDEIDGSVTSQDFHGDSGGYNGYTVYFVMKTDRPFQSFGTWSGDTQTDGSRSALQAGQSAPEIGAYMRYPSGVAGPVTVRIGISYVDLAGAQANLEAEAGNKTFDAIRKQAAHDWDQELGILSVQGGTTTQRTIFYTSLYHSLLMPSIFSDVDGRYIGFDNQINQVKAGHLMYANFSAWDIYRSEVPLFALIEPQRLEDMCQSVVVDYAQGGWMPRWPQITHYTRDMCGSPLTIVLATAWQDGLRDFDMDTGYQGMLQDATQAPAPGKPYGGESNIQYINQVGYDPNDMEHSYGSVSQTEEDCIAYASLARVSLSLGYVKDADMLDKRAQDYRNVFNPDTKFIQPKLLDGSWRTPFNPTQGDGYAEGSAWQYRWLVPQDVAGLIDLMGGDDYFNAQLDQFFDYPQLESAGQYYNPYNEPDLQAPFLYDYSGAPWKTQARVRELDADAYTTSPGGIPGNDDCGEMSSWYVMSAIGLYAVDPADSTYELTSPLFTKVTVHLQQPYTGSSFVISAPAASMANAYIQGVDLNGTHLANDWISHSDITHGGKIIFALGAAPDKDWGAELSARPPSLTH